MNAQGHIEVGTKLRSKRTGDLATVDHIEDDTEVGKVFYLRYGTGRNARTTGIGWQLHALEEDWKVVEG